MSTPLTTYRAPVATAEQMARWEREHQEKLDRQTDEAAAERSRRASEPSLALRVSWVERAWDRRAGRAR